MTHITITLPMPDKAVTQNAFRGQSRKAALMKSRIVKEHRTRARLYTMAALRPEQRRLDWIGYSLSFFFKTSAFRDEGNAESSTKSLIDGICDALGRDDKNFNKVKLSTRAKDAKNPRVEITIYSKEQP